MIDHQLGQEIAIYEDDLIVDARNKIMSIHSKCRRGNKDTFLHAL